MYHIDSKEISHVLFRQANLLQGPCSTWFICNHLLELWPIRMYFTWTNLLLQSPSICFMHHSLSIHHR